MIDGGFVDGDGDGSRGNDYVKRSEVQEVEEMREDGREKQRYDPLRWCN